MLCPAPCGKGHPVTVGHFPERKISEHPDKGAAHLAMAELSHKSIQDGKPRRFVVK